jgi:hypothetical protein
MKAKLLLFLVITTLVAGCSGLVGPQKVAVPVELPDGTVTTNMVDVASLTPAALEALRATSALLPPPWNTITSIAIGAGLAGLTAYGLNRRKTGVTK